MDRKKHKGIIMLPLTHNNMPIDMSIGMGKSPKMRSVTIFGLIPTTSITRQLVWGLGEEIVNTGIFPSVATSAFISSSDDLDISIMRVTFLDAGYNEIKEDITLTGNLPVALSVPAIRVNHVVNVSSVSLQGDVYVGTEAGAVSGVPLLINTMQYVSKDRQVDSGMFYSVPLGHTLLVTDFSGGNTRNEENDLQGLFTFGNSGNLVVGLDMQLTSNYVDLPISYFAVSEKSDIAVTTQSNTGNNDVVRGRLRGILIENSLLGEDNV